MLFNIIKYISTNLMFFTGAYSNEVFPDKLPKDIEDEYIKRHLNGDEEARKKLIEHNLRLVAHIVKKFETSEQDIDDLIADIEQGYLDTMDEINEKMEEQIKMPEDGSSRLRQIAC